MEKESTQTDVNKTEDLLHTSNAEPATEAEMQEFWKNLRTFYRTSKKATNHQQRSFSSPFLSLLKEDEEPYPFALNTDGEIKEPDVMAPFKILDHLLEQHQQVQKKAFRQELTILIHSLKKLLNIEDYDIYPEEEVYGFANEMISFDKLSELTPAGTATTLTKTREKRLTWVLSGLTEGLKSYNEHDNILLVDNKFKKSISKKSFKRSKIIGADSFKKAQKLLSDHIATFTSLIKAYRIAKLEIGNEYKEDIHDDYFNYFTWYRLDSEELNLIHPVIQVVDHKYLFKDLSSMSTLLASNQPVKIIVLNNELISTPDKNMSWDDASHQYRQEIAAIAIAHRNAYLFQSSLHNPDAIVKGLDDCLRFTSPALCHISVPNKNIKDPLLTAKAENAGRYFPTITYNPNVVNEWGGRFDLSQNIQMTEKWPEYTLKVNKDNSEESINVEFTYADYKALYPEKVEELMIIPEAYYTDKLMPLHEYIEAEEKELYGKIPYIWLVNEKNELQRAAVPNVWVVSCQERLDFWSFLQELGGINSYQAKTGGQLREEELQKQHQLEIEQVQKSAVNEAVERLIGALLQDDMKLEDLLKDPDKISAPQPTTQQTETRDDKGASTEAKADTQKEEKKSSENKPAAPVEKPWVESESCTSCNECTDMYPGLFKYNEDNQAYLTDPKKGTYEQLVKAAEKCPAACIHPGLPLDPNEKNAEKLIKRAGKFN